MTMPTSPDPDLVARARADYLDLHRTAAPLDDLATEQQRWDAAVEAEADWVSSCEYREAHDEAMLAAYEPDPADVEADRRWHDERFRANATPAEIQARDAALASATRAQADALADGDEAAYEMARDSYDEAHRRNYRLPDINEPEF